MCFVDMRTEEASGKEAVKLSDLAIYTKLSLPLTYTAKNNFGYPSCDGARSFVRKRLGYAFEGDTDDSLYVRIDGILKTNIPHADEIVLVISSFVGHACSVLRKRDLTRFTVPVRRRIQSQDFGTVTIMSLDHGTSRIGFPIVDTHDRESGDPLKFNLDDLLKLTKSRMAPWEVEFEDVHWWTVFPVTLTFVNELIIIHLVGQRLVEQFSYKDRIFLCGINLGLMDAHNLAWKLLWYERKGAKNMLLGTYNEERRSIAEQVIDLDKKLVSYAALKAPRGFSPGLNSTFAKELNYTMMRFAGFSCGTGIEYNDSFLNAIDYDMPPPASGRGLKPGQRAPDHWVATYPSGQATQIHTEMPHTGCFYLLIFVGDLVYNMGRIQTLVEHLSSDGSFMRRFGGGIENTESFSVLFVTTTTGFDNSRTKELADSLSTAPFKMIADKHEGKVGGMHALYGVDDELGAVVVIRPDGWTGAWAILDRYQKVDDYFAEFLESQCDIR
ncbi:thioredoxin-like protein [Jimgerdemannia flammicorona]|uniref:Thioredoxin-like protein n=1 Tax=Jimgerdemannia flammicorona TaxID=994334 RepID=A0A433DNI7_9FUNG|nr:thioredoxin-like protein [Jimgerdemannia flammicorona]